MATAESPSGIDPRDLRAATEYLLVVEIAPDLYHVYSQDGTEYTVDVRDGVCSCPDHEYREAHCKHLRRVEQERGERDVPTGVRIDPILARRAGRAA